jgi:hypothetical protein
MNIELISKGVKCDGGDNIIISVQVFSMSSRKARII